MRTNSSALHGTVETSTLVRCGGVCYPVLRMRSTYGNTGGSSAQSMSHLMIESITVCLTGYTPTKVGPNGPGGGCPDPLLGRRGSCHGEMAPQKFRRGRTCF